MTKLEIYLHATLQQCRDVIDLSGGASTDEQLMICKLADDGHREYLRKLGEEIARKAPAGPGGVKHGE